MNDEGKHQSLAAIIRGLYLDVTGKSWIVCQDMGDLESLTIPSEAIVIDITSAADQWTLPFQFDEDVAKILHEAFTAWEFDRAPSGVEALTKTTRTKSFPS
jgi:hypothetical protein